MGIGRKGEAPKKEVQSVSGEVKNLGKGDKVGKNLHDGGKGRRSGVRKSLGTEKVAQALKGSNG